MLTKRLVSDVTGKRKLCETYSTLGHKLLQVETGILYGSSVVDVIAGYDENNVPYSRFTYEESEEMDEDGVELHEDA